MNTILADSRKVDNENQRLHKCIEWSNVEAVQNAQEEAQQAKKREAIARRAKAEAEEQALDDIDTAKSQANLEIARAKKEAAAFVKLADARAKSAGGYLTFIIFLLILTSKTWREDISNFATAPADYLSEFPYAMSSHQGIILIVILIALVLIGLAVFIWYLSEWGELTKWVALVSLSVIAVIPDKLKDIGVTINLVTLYISIQLITFVIIKLLNHHYANEQDSSKLRRWEATKGLYHVITHEKSKG